MFEKNLKGTYGQNQLHQMGSYTKSALSLKGYIKAENSRNSHQHTVFVQGQPLELQRMYQTGFITSQGVLPR